jgi:hypothetical protein
MKMWPISQWVYSLPPTKELSTAAEQFPDEFTPMVYMSGDGHRKPPFQGRRKVCGRAMSSSVWLAKTDIFVLRLMRWIPRPQPRRRRVRNSPSILGFRSPGHPLCHRKALNCGKSSTLLKELCQEFSGTSGWLSLNNTTAPLDSIIVSSRFKVAVRSIQ